MEDRSANLVSGDGEAASPVPDSSRSDMQARSVTTKWNINWQCVSAIILALTMVFVARQAFETGRSTNILRSSIEVQHQPIVIATAAAVRTSPEALRNKIRFSCSGKIPAYELVRTRDLIFYIDANEQEFQTYLANKKDEKATEKYSCYLREFLKIMNDYFDKNPNPTKEELEAYLRELQSNPKTITTEVVGKMRVVMAFDKFHVFPEIWEYETLSHMMMAPDTWRDFENGRSISQDVLAPVFDYKRLLFYFTALEYEGLQKHKKLKSYFLGYLGGSGRFKAFKVESPAPIGSSSEIQTIFDKDRDGEIWVEYNKLRVWSTRLDIPD